jgi:AbrB family looped-hinge helix DNA binding protein
MRIGGEHTGGARAASARADRSMPNGTIHGMVTTIDSAGRIVVPKRLREQLGFKAGQKLELSAADGRLEVEHIPTPMRLQKREGRLVAVADQPMPVLSSQVVRETLEQVRR